MLIKYFMIILSAVIFGIFIGYFEGKRHTSNIVMTKSGAGVCIRGQDGEVYLRMSQAGQEKLADPETQFLILRVIDGPTRNNHPL